MATKRYYATGDFRYGTRMMRAGDPVDMAAPDARLYRALNRITERKPRGAVPEQPSTADETPPAPKAPAKRKARRRSK